MHCWWQGPSDRHGLVQRYSPHLCRRDARSRHPRILPIREHVPRGARPLVIGQASVHRKAYHAPLLPRGQRRRVRAPCEGSGRARPHGAEGLHPGIEQSSFPRKDLCSILIDTMAALRCGLRTLIPDLFFIFPWILSYLPAHPIDPSHPPSTSFVIS